MNVKMFKRPYTNLACVECGKCFTSKSHLKRHCLIHTGKKDYICEICLHPFTRNDNLRRHMWSIHAYKELQ